MLKLSTLQTKLSFLKTIDFWSVVLLLALPFNIGKVIYTESAWLDGSFVNYFQVRITLAFILSIILIVARLLFAKKDVFSTSLIWILCFFWIYNILSNLISGSNPQFLLVSSINLFEWLVIGYALLISIAAWSKNKYQYLGIIGLATVSLLEICIQIAQIITTNPVVPQVLSVLGQPVKFTSFTYTGIDIFTRGYGTTAHPNILSAIMNFFLVLILSARIKSLQKVLFVLVPIVCVALTLSRAGILCTVLIISLYAFTKFGKSIIKRAGDFVRKYFALLLFLGSFVLVLIAILVQLFLKNYINSYFLTSRGLLLDQYFAIITSSPAQFLLGSGFLSSIQKLHNMNSFIPSTYMQLINEPPHNILVLLLTEFGIVGVSTFILAIVFILTKIKKQKFFTADSFFLLLGILMIILVIGSFDHLLIY